MMKVHEQNQSHSTLPNLLSVRKPTLQIDDFGEINIPQGYTLLDDAVPQEKVVDKLQILIAEGLKPVTCRTQFIGSQIKRLFPSDE